MKVNTNIRYFLFALTFFMLLNGCKKQQNTYYDYECDNTYQYHYLPDSIASWYNQVVDSNNYSKNYESKSSTGLSETIVVKKGTRWHQMNECGGNFYFNTNYDYTSNLYGNSFSILMAFKTNIFPISFLWNLDAIKVDTSKFELIIHTLIPNGNASNFNYLDLKQQIGPDFSTQMKAIYYKNNYTTIDSLICDTCIQYNGKYVQGGNTYNEVYRYINPITFGNSNTLKELLIDKKHGVIQFTNKDNTIWTVDPF